MANWYTADTHFGDDGIRRFFQRPFRSVAAMDAAMVDAIAARLSHDDDLWIVGDFATEGSEAAIFERLPGRKHLVRGNHDAPSVNSLAWTSIHDLVEVEDRGQKFVLCHYPLLTWNNARDGAVNLFGHVHTNWLGADNQVNVGVDLWSFAPIQAGDLLRRAVSLPENVRWQKVEGSF